MYASPVGLPQWFLPRGTSLFTKSAAASPVKLVPAIRCCGSSRRGPSLTPSHPDALTQVTVLPLHLKSKQGGGVRAVPLDGGES